MLKYSHRKTATTTTSVFKIHFLFHRCVYRILTSIDKNKKYESNIFDETMAVVAGGGMGGCLTPPPDRKAVGIIKFSQ